MLSIRYFPHYYYNNYFIIIIIIILFGVLYVLYVFYPYILNVLSVLPFLFPDSKINLSVISINVKNIIFFKCQYKINL